MIASIRAQIELRIGYLPTFFDPALANAELLEAMWQQTRAAYLDNPLPPTFKEALLLSVMRRCPTPYGLVGHAAALARQGVRAGEILALLEDLSGPQAELRQHVEALTGCSEAWAQWPSPGPLADAVLVTSIAYTLDPTSCVAVQVELRRLLPAELYSRWSALLAYVRARWQWCAAYPELALRTESPLAESRARLLEEEPRLAAHLSPAETLTEQSLSRRLTSTSEALSQIIDAVPTGILQLSIDGAVVMTNAPAQRMFGLTADEFSRLTVSDLEQSAVREDGQRCPPEAFPMTRCLRTLTPQPPITLGMRHKDGELFWAVLTALPLMDPAAQETTGVMVTVVDISERKRAERALRESETQYRQLVEASNVYVMCLDRDGRITRANEQAAKMMRSRAEAMLGKTMTEVMRSSELAEAHHARYMHVMNTGLNIDIEEMIEFEGQTVWLASTVMPLSCVQGPDSAGARPGPICYGHGGAAISPLAS